MKNQSQIAEIKTIKIGLRSYIEAIDTLPSGTNIVLQLGAVLAPMRNLSIDQAKTVLRKFDQALALFDESHTAIPTLEVMPVNDLDAALTSSVQEIFNKKAGLVNEETQQEENTQAQQEEVTAANVAGHPV